MDKDEILKGLNENQKKAVLQTEGPVLIVAGAGSGKTKALTHRLAYLIASDVSPEKILMVTFTNKAALEMKQRVEGLLKDKKEAAKPFIGTFHRLGVFLLRKAGGGFGRNANFSISDQQDSHQLIKNCLKELDLPKEQFNPAGVENEISRAKNQLLEPEEYREKAANFFQEKISSVYNLYEEKLAQNNSFDFDDLISKTVLLLKKNQKNNLFLEKFQNLWQYIMVDEYQDTNFSQYQLIKLLARKHNNICAVGDDDQAIYSWRQADIRNFLEFESDWPGAKIIILGENYRTNKTILSAAQKVIEKNIWRKKKDLYTKNPQGQPVYLAPVDSDLAEADFAAKTILDLTKSNQLKLSDFAVLYRTNAQSRVLEEAFLKKGIDYQIFAGVKFYERKEIKDLSSYLRLIFNPLDLASLERVINIPSRKIGAKKQVDIFQGEKKSVWTRIKSLPEAGEFIETIKAGRKIAEENSSLADLTGFIIEKTKYKKYLESDLQRGKERWENVLEFLRIVEEPPKKGLEGLKYFLEEIALFQDNSNENIAKKEAVKLMTLHSAKGLEFKCVFMVGLEEGLLPHSQSQFNEEELEEERRLAYVGMTRAKERLYLLFSRKRRVFGGISANPPSRFLSDIPADLIQQISFPSFNFEKFSSGDDETEYDEDGIEVI